MRDDRRSSLVDVGRQSEVKVNTIRWRDVHELRIKGVVRSTLPPTNGIYVSINHARRHVIGRMDKPRGM